MHLMDPYSQQQWLQDPSGLQADGLRQPGRVQGAAVPNHPATRSQGVKTASSQQQQQPVSPLKAAANSSSGVQFHDALSLPLTCSSSYAPVPGMSSPSNSPGAPAASASCSQHNSPAFSHSAGSNSASSGNVPGLTQGLGVGAGAAGGHGFMSMNANGMCMGMPVQMAWSPFGAPGMMQQMPQMPQLHTDQYGMPVPAQGGMSRPGSWGLWPPAAQDATPPPLDQAMQHSTHTIQPPWRSADTPYVSGTPEQVLKRTSSDKAAVPALTHGSVGDDAMDGGDEAHGNVCWICLDAGGDLIKPCKCPRACHGPCLARWQLHCAGKDEEVRCRFCSSVLPDWKPSVVPSAAKGAEAPAYMRISYNGRSHKIRVRQGVEGRAEFIADCRKLLKIPRHLDFDVVFHCKEPQTQADLRFRGLGAYDAAVLCAAVASHAPTQPAAAPAALPLVRAESEAADALSNYHTSGDADTHMTGPGTPHGGTQGGRAVNADPNAMGRTRRSGPSNQGFFPDLGGALRWGAAGSGSGNGSSSGSRLGEDDGRGAGGSSSGSSNNIVDRVLHWFKR